MRYYLFTVCIGLVVLGSWTSSCAAQSKYKDPARFESSIKAFEAEDAKQPPQPGSVLCTGSSTMRMWHAKIHEDLAPLTVVPRGFGGSTMHDLLYYTDRIVLPYKPRAIVVYEGDNDVWTGVGAAEIHETFGKFVEKVHAKLPDTRIYFLSIKPSYSRRAKWSVMQQANRLIAEDCSRDERLHYVDIAPILLDDDGQVRRELFKEDDLHLNRSGYEKLRDLVAPILKKHELKYEQ